MGVCLFLVITGFLLAYGSSLDNMSGGFSVKRYFFKRIKRLYPPLLLVILVTVGIYHFFLPGILEDNGKEIVSVLLGFNNWWQLAMNADYFARMVNASPFTHMWFLGVEIEYVALWPFLFLICARIGKRFGIILLLSCGIISSILITYMVFVEPDISRLYYGTDTRVFACLFGGVMGLWFAGSKNRVNDDIYLRDNCYFLFVALLLPILIYAFLFDGQNLLVYLGVMQLVTLIFCLMLYIVIKSSKLGNWLENPIFKWIGEHNYEIFLWQYPVLCFFQRKGWHELTYGVVLEIFIILFLSAWSKEVLAFIFNFKLPFDGENLRLRIFRYVFASTVALSLVIMGYGIRDVLASDFDPNHKPGYALKKELEEKQAELIRIQKEREAKKRMEEEQIRTAQEKLAAKLRGSGITMIGDSVMLGSSPAILKDMPDVHIDALASRNVCDGFEIAKKLQQEGKLGDTVVVGLGTNGPLLQYEPYASGMKNLLNVLGSERQIFWVTVYCSYSQWMDMNNQYLAELERTRPNFHLIDWYSVAKQNPNLLHSDGTHPNIDGIIEYARLVRETLSKKITVK